MKKSILRELDCVGSRVVAIQLDPIEFPLSMVSDCARDVEGLTVDESGLLTVGPSDAGAFEAFRQFCSRLLATKMSSL
jgi:hypothetical protein